MKCKATKFIKLIIVLLILCADFSTATAQCDPETDPFCDPEGNEDDPFAVPIDGGAIALLVGGAALGYKALKKKKEESAD